MATNRNDLDDLLICNLYVNERKSTTEIAKLYNVCASTINKRLKKNNIKLRNYILSQYNYLEKENPDKILTKLILEQLYIKEKISMKDISIKYNCDPCVIDRLLSEYKIIKRTKAQSKIGILSGEKHWNYKGGLTSLNDLLREYFNINIAQNIRKRDMFKCKICSSKKDLHVHHIKLFSSIVELILNEHKDLNIEDNKLELYNIIISDNRFTNEDNLITVCKLCHIYKIHNCKKTIRSEASLEERSTTIPYGSTL